MPEHRKETKPATPPWWLHGGDEDCPHCGHPYHLEGERRCAGCDAPACADCLVDEDGLCPDCAKEARR